MSNANDIILSIADFLDAVADLLDSDAVDGVITIAKQLGLEDQINTGIDKVIGFANDSKSTLEEWKKELTGVQGFASSVRLVYPLIESIGDIVSNTAEAVKKAGIESEGLFQATEAISTGTDYFTGAIKGTISLLDNIPTVASVEEVITSIGNIQEVVLSFKTKAEAA